MSRAPLDTNEFRSNFQQCATFLLEYADPWYVDEPEKEQLYNKLSRGEISPPIRGADLAPFTDTLQRIIHGSHNKVVLERSPVNYSPNHNQVQSQLLAGQIDAATALYRAESEKLADSIVTRDEELIDEIVRPLLERNGTLFGIRGLMHFAHMRYLLKSRNINATFLRFAMPNLTLTLDERIIGAMTLHQRVDNVEILRRFYVSAGGSNRQDVVDGMSERSLRQEILRFLGR